MWTRSCFSISCVLSFLYSQKYFQKVWTGGQFRKIIIKMNNVFYHYKVRTCEQEAVFVFHVFFLSCILQNIFKKCGQVDKFWKFWKKNNFHLMYFIIIKCGLVEKKLYLYFPFSLFCLPSKIFSKSVDRWTRSCISILCFLSFLYPPNHFQKVWTGGQVLKVLKKIIFT